MKFEIKLSSDSIFSGDAATLEFILSSGPQEAKFPSGYQSSDVVSVILFNDYGEEIGRSTDFEAIRRWDPSARLEKQADMEAINLPPNQEAKWKRGLTDYFGSLPPGQYGIQGEYNFKPSGIVLRSQMAKFQALPNETAWLDVVKDDAAIGMIYLAQQPTFSDQIMMHWRAVREPGKILKAAAMDFSSTGKPSLALTDYHKQSQLESAYPRWLVWSEKGEINSVLLHPEKPGHRKTFVPESKHIEIVSRSIQHDDLTVTIPVLEQKRGNFHLSLIHFDSDFVPSKSIPTIHFSEQPQPAYLSSEWTGKLYFTSAVTGNLPIRAWVLQDGKAGPSQEIVPSGWLQHNDSEVVEETVLALELRSGAAYTNREAALAVIHWRGTKSQGIRVARIPLNREKGIFDIEATRFFDIPLEEELAAVEWAYAAVEQNPMRDIHALIVAQDGRVYHFQAGEGPNLVKTVQRGQISSVRLIATSQSDIYACLPGSSTGAELHLLVEAVRR